MKLDVLTVFTLGNAVLNSFALSKVRDLCPILIKFCGTAESAAVSVCGDVPRRRGSSTSHSVEIWRNLCSDCGGNLYIKPRLELERVELVSVSVSVIHCGTVLQLN